MKKRIIMSSIHALKKSISLLAIMQRKFLKKIMPLLMIYNPHLIKVTQNAKNAIRNKIPLSHSKIRGFFYALEQIFNKCAIEGMLSPCCDDVGDINAPVAMNKMFFNLPDFSCCMIYEQNTEPEHPHPEPPA